MKRLIQYLLLNNWQRKVTATLLATIIWFVVDYSATMQRRFNYVPVYLKNIKPNHTVKGLRNGERLPYTVSLTLKGKRSWLTDTRSQDLRVILDAGGKKSHWTPKITNEHIYNSTTQKSLASSVSEVIASPLNIRIEPTVEVPLTVYVAKPKGSCPRGYELVGVSPRKFRTLVRTTAEEAEHFRSTNAQVDLDLNRISVEKLDALAKKAEATGSEIISFEIPDNWKKFTLPNGSDKQEVLSSSAAKQMCINFIKEKLLPLSRKIPISIFLPQRMNSHLSPELITLSRSKNVELENGVHVLNLDLMVGGVSPEFLDIVRDFLQISILFEQPDSPQSKLKWSLEFINDRKLEKLYANEAMAARGLSKSAISELRQEFRTFYSQMRLYTAPGELLNLEIRKKGHSIDVRPISHARKVTTKVAAAD